MKKLIESLNRYCGLQKEMAEFEKLENKTRADILTVARSDISLDLQRQKIKDSRLTLDLVDVKRDKIIQPLLDAERELAASLNGHVEAWNSAITKGIAEIESQVIENTLEFFKGDERACRRFWEEGNMYRLSIFYNWRYASYDTSFLKQRTQKDLVETTRDFLRFAERNATELGINLSTLN